MKFLTPNVLFLLFLLPLMGCRAGNGDDHALLSATGKVSPQADPAALRQYRNPGSAPEHGSIAEQGSVSYSVLNVEFTDADACNRFQVPGAFVYSRFQNFADLFVECVRRPQGVSHDAAVIEQVTDAGGVKWVDINGVAQVPPRPREAPPQDVAREAHVEEIVRGGILNLTGKGVVLAVVDTGVDFRNPDFIRPDSAGRPTSRLLYFWDTTSTAYAGGKLGSRVKAPLSYPNGEPIGTVYTGEELTADLRSTAPQILSGDTNGHGTACMSIAGGNGNNSDRKYVGVAPDADLIAVRIGGQSETLPNSYLLNSICGWLDQVVPAGTPLVISCSFGSHMGGHDGSLVAEHQLDARFPLNKPGRAICVAAGNEGEDPIHAELTFQGENSPGVLRWQAPQGGGMAIYYDMDSADDLHVEGMDEAAFKEKTFVHPLTGLLQSKIHLDSGGELRFSSPGKAMHLDAYIAGPGALFAGPCVSHGKQVAAPGTANHVITVGSYDWNNLFDAKGETIFVPLFFHNGKKGLMTIGEISSYSNPGPSRMDQREENPKPDIVAPGQYFTAAAPAEVKLIRDTSGKYQLFNGTSASTPYVAGIVALLLQEKPALNLGEIKQLFRDNATVDQYTQKVPNGTWGNGKLDRKAVIRMVQALQSAKE